MAADVQLAAVDGDRVEAGAVVATLTGRHADLLTVERTMLNLLGHLLALRPPPGGWLTWYPGLRPPSAKPARPCPACEDCRSMRCTAVGAVCIGLDFRCALQRQPLGHHAFVGEGSGSRLQGCPKWGRSGLLRLKWTLWTTDTVLSFESGVVDIILLDNMPPEMMAERFGDAMIDVPRWNWRPPGSQRPPSKPWPNRGRSHQCRGLDAFGSELDLGFDLVENPANPLPFLVHDRGLHQPDDVQDDHPLVGVAAPATTGSGPFDPERCCWRRMAFGRRRS